MVEGFFTLTCDTAKMQIIYYSVEYLNNLIIINVVRTCFKVKFRVSIIHHNVIPTIVCYKICKIWQQNNYPNNSLNVKR